MSYNDSRLLLCMFIGEERRLEASYVNVVYFTKRKKMLIDWRYDIQCLSSWSAISQNFKSFQVDWCYWGRRADICLRRNLITSALSFVTLPSTHAFDNVIFIVYIDVCSLFSNINGDPSIYTAELCSLTKVFGAFNAFNDILLLVVYRNLVRRIRFDVCGL